MSVITAISIPASRIALVARFDKLSGSQAPAQSSVFTDCSILGNRQIAGIPRLAASRAAATTRSTVSRCTPGIEGMS